MVYIDDMYKLSIGKLGRMKMSHMIADTPEELLKMAKAIGVNLKWIQHKGTCNEHFDICFSKRQLALSLGATEISYRDYAKQIEQRCEKHGIHWARASVDKINQL